MSIWGSIDGPEVYACEVDHEPGELVYQIGVATTWHECIRLGSWPASGQTGTDHNDWGAMIPVAHAKLLRDRLTEAIAIIESKRHQKVYPDSATQAEWLTRKPEPDPPLGETAAEFADRIMRNAKVIADAIEIKPDDL